VVVPPSPSLSKIGSVRVRAEIYLDPKTNPRRHNIVEGHNSFALAVHQEDSVRGTVLASDNTWLGIKTPPGVITHRQWTDVDFWYDGVGAAEIRVDGVRAASSYDSAHLMRGPLAGPVRGVGALGVFVGHWAVVDRPTENDRYTFDGYIRRPQVYKRDDHDLLDLLDPCCKTDPAFAHKLAETLRERGLGLEGIQKTLDEIHALGAGLFRDLIGGDEARAGDLQRLLQQYLYGLRHRRDGIPLEPSLRRLLGWIADHATRDGLKAAVERYTALIGKLPLSEKEIDELTKQMCFGGTKETIEREVKRLVEDETWRKRVEKFRRER
jgi:hypothetical protein